MQKIRLLTVLFVLATLAFSVAVVAQKQKTRRLSTNLRGSAEAPNPGDADGKGRARFTMDPNKGEICYELTVSGIQDATAAHIHEAPAGKNGPVKVPLKTPENGSSKDCVSVDQALLTQIIQNPANYYVNVHNAEFKGGAVRGQLGK